VKPLCGSRGFAGASACILRAGHEGPHEYGNFDSAVLKNKSEELERLRAENFALAANQCNNIVGDEGGTPVCKEVVKLRAENVSLREDKETLVRNCNQMFDAIAAEQERNTALRAENEALRADAERYRWLRREECPLTVFEYEEISGLWEEKLDAAIDAAREEQ
jgi:hypothetical protein